MPKKKQGIFITFEGPEGSGKSTHSRLLAAWLKKEGHSVVLTQEPGGTVLGKQLRKILLDHKNEKMDVLTELCLYEASRAVLLSEVIEPALVTGKVVIVDRFQDSTWVYQGWAGGLDLEFIERIGKFAMKGIQPDLTVLLDLPAKEGLERVKDPNRMEAKPLAFHEKVRKGYLELFRREPKRIKKFSVQQPMNEVQDAIRKAAADVLG